MSNRFPPPTFFRFDYGAPPVKTKEEQLKWELDIALQRLDAMCEIPGIFAVVLDLHAKHVTINTGPQTLSVARPKAMKGLGPGAIVRLVQSDKPAICEVVAEPPATGPIATVKQIVDIAHVEIDLRNEKRIALVPEHITLKENDRILLDPSGTAVVRNLGKTVKTNTFTEETNVSWDDIGGLDEAKSLLQEAIEAPFKQPELFKRYGMTPTRGVLLHGPPGTGKTMLGKAAATGLARLHGDSARAGGFIYVKGPEVMNMFVGNSEANIRNLFTAAREHAKIHNYPAIIFIDEADAIMGRRGARPGFEGMERTLVPQFLAEMDGLEDSGCMVLLATNRPDTLDPAVVRIGRIDIPIYIGRPSKEDSEKIFQIYMKNVPPTDGETIADLIKVGTDALFDDKHALIMLRCKNGKDTRFGLKDLVSGALISGLVSVATKLAFRRERDGKTPRGVTREDICEAVRQTTERYKALDHTAALQDFVEQKKLKDEIIGVEKIL